MIATATHFRRLPKHRNKSNEDLHFGSVNFSWHKTVLPRSTGRAVSPYAYISQSNISTRIIWWAALTFSGSLSYSACDGDLSSNLLTAICGDYSDVTALHWVAWRQPEILFPNKGMAVTIRNYQNLDSYSWIPHRGRHSKERLPTLPCQTSESYINVPTLASRLGSSSSRRSFQSKISALYAFWLEWELSYHY